MLPKDSCMPHSKTYTILCEKSCHSAFLGLPELLDVAPEHSYKEKNTELLLSALIKIKVITTAVCELKYCAQTQIQELGLGNLQEAAVGIFKHIFSYFPKFRLRTELCLEIRIMNELKLMPFS